MNRKPQNGSALLLVLIIVVVLSLLGVAGMKSATFEQNMASNEAQKATTFQAAESGLEGALKVDTLSDAVEAGKGMPVSYSLVASGSTHIGVAANVTTTYVGGNLGSSTAGGSIEGIAGAVLLGNTIEKTEVFYFTLRSQATMDGTGSVSRHVRTVQRIRIDN